MTPTAVTPAARTKRAQATEPPKTARGASSRAVSPHPSTPRPAHRAPLGRTTTPRSPRRVSGPAPRRATTPAGNPTRATPARAPRPTAPVRTPRTAPSRRRVREPSALPLSARTFARLRTLPDHSLLDRIVRGRLWIPLLGVLLAGIVATQVEVLKLNASIGRSVVSASALSGDNQVLRARISQLSNDQRIEQVAESYGMRMSPVTAELFLPGGGAGSTLSRALRNIRAPNPTSFGAQTAATATSRANAVPYSSGQ